MVSLSTPFLTPSSIISTSSMPKLINPCFILLGKKSKISNSLLMESNNSLIYLLISQIALLQLLFPNISRSLNALPEKETLNLWFSLKNILLVIKLISNLSLGLLILGILSILSVISPPFQ